LAPKLQNTRMLTLLESLIASLQASFCYQICEYCPSVGPNTLLDGGDDCNLCCCTRKCGLRGLCMVVLAEIPRIRGAAACGPCTAPTAQVGMTLLSSICLCERRSCSLSLSVPVLVLTHAHSYTHNRSIFFCLSPSVTHTLSPSLLTSLPFLCLSRGLALALRPSCWRSLSPYPCSSFLACAGSDTHNHWFCTFSTLSPSIILALAPSINFCCCPVSLSSVLSPSFAMLPPPPPSLALSRTLSRSRALSLAPTPSLTRSLFFLSLLLTRSRFLSCYFLALSRSRFLSLSLSFSLARSLAVCPCRYLSRWLAFSFCHSML